jgi:hypothetical protein
MMGYEEASLTISFDGRSNANIVDDEDDEHLRNIMSSPLERSEEISLIEAGLIWYFRPRYNKIFRDTQPNEGLTTLKSLYSLDFSALTVEINTEDLWVRLFSEERKPGHHHIAAFDLHDAAQRRPFFSDIDSKGNVQLLDISGPIF